MSSDILYRSLAMLFGWLGSFNDMEQSIYFLLYRKPIRKGETVCRTAANLYTGNSGNFVSKSAPKSLYYPNMVYKLFPRKISFYICKLILRWFAIGTTVRILSGSTRSSLLRYRPTLVFSSHICSNLTLLIVAAFQVYRRLFSLLCFPFQWDGKCF